MEHLEGKKIIYLITQSKYGGAQKYVLQLARHFKQANDVLIVVGEKEHQDPHFFAEARALGIEPSILTHLIRDISIVQAFEAVMEIRKFLIKERPDFVHINSSMAGAIGSCAAWLYRLDPLNKLIRVVYTAHGFVFNEPMPIWRKKMYVFIEKISASWKGAIITVSNFDKDEGLKNKIAPDKRMVVIHNGVDMPPFQVLEKIQARDVLNLAHDVPVIGTVASFYKTKGLENLIASVALLKEKNPRMQCIIVGDGPERQQLEAQVKSLGLEDMVKLLNQSVRSELFTLNYLNAFDIFILPSLKEGLPFSILNAGLTGVPVIASRVGGIPEIIEHQASGLLVSPARPDELALAIQTLLADKRLASRYADALRDRVRKNFTLSAMLKKTEELYLKFYLKIGVRK